MSTCTAVLVLLGLSVIAEAMYIAKYDKRLDLNIRFGTDLENPEAYKRDVVPQLTANAQYYYQGPDGQIYYYVIGPDGQAYYVQGGQSLPTQQEVKESGGGFLSWLGKPLNAVGNIVGKTGDVVSTIIDLPFSAARQVVSGVGLEDTGVGRVATGILNAGQTIVDTPVSLVLDVAELPFRAAAGVVENVDEE